MMDLPKKPLERIKLVEINPYLTCYLCKGYLIDATTISECLHSFCRSCIIRFLQDNSHCPVCEVMINKAKPNIKLDKTLQDIVYKLVPELFVLEMARRRAFYRRHPVQAAKATPEERGEDTERTIFNPKDTISLSIEYISDDSTPGAIKLPPCKEETANGRNGTNMGASDCDNTIRRFLQCPGMCRVDVLKKFVRNKYNVDTSLFYIDILYKRVPLPDHYTLIDIAYIYSWKRNEPMKFFFRITDVNLASDSFDFMPPQPVAVVEPVKTGGGNSGKVKIRAGVVRGNKRARKGASQSEKEEKVEPKEVHNSIEKEITQEIKNRIQNEPSLEKNAVYTNITLNRSNNVEIITKIQKVSNKNGQPIGLNIIKQTVKKPKPQQQPPQAVNSVPNEAPEPEPRKPEKTDTDVKTPPGSPPPSKKTGVLDDVDVEKSNFLKSIELTAKNVIKAMSPRSPEKEAVRKSSPAKRKTSSPPSKSKRQRPSPKKPVNTKSIQNPAVRQMVSNVNQNASHMSRIVEQNSPKSSTIATTTTTSQELQSLFDSCKINIPSSLSITLKETGEDRDGSSGLPGTIRPVKNYIEILKLPDVMTSNNEDQQRGDKPPKTDESPSVTTVPLPTKLTPPAPQPTAVPNKMPNVPTTQRDNNLVKLNPRSPQTFQKMFEEAIKKPEFSGKFQTVVAKVKEEKKAQQKCALDLTTGEGVVSASASASAGKRNLMEIASQLYKKTKLEQEKNGLSSSNGLVDKNGAPPGKVAIPRLNSQKNPSKQQEVPKSPVASCSTGNSPKFGQQTVAGLHSPTLGMNYTVSVAKTSPKQRRSTSPKTSPKAASKPPADVPPASAKAPASAEPLPPSKPSSPMTTVTTSAAAASLSPNQLLEKYNIQNLAQLTASFNFNAAANFGMSPVSQQLAALQQAMIYKHFELQNRQNWLSMNPNPLVQYEKYLQSLSGGAAQGGKQPLLGSVVKEN